MDITPNFTVCSVELYTPILHSPIIYKNIYAFLYLLDRVLRERFSLFFGTPPGIPNGNHVPIIIRAMLPRGFLLFER